MHSGFCQKFFDLVKTKHLRQGLLCTHTLKYVQTHTQKCFLFEQIYECHFYFSPYFPLIRKFKLVKKNHIAKQQTCFFLCFFHFLLLLCFKIGSFYRIENRSTIPDVFLSKTIPKINSPHQMPLLSAASQPQYHHSHQQNQQQLLPSTSTPTSASLVSFLNTIHTSKPPAKTNSSTSCHAPTPPPSSSSPYCNEMKQQQHQPPPQSTTDENNDSTAVQIHSTSSLIGRNGIKSNLNPLNLIQFGENATNINAAAAINTGDNSNNDYCNTSNSGTGEAKAYKLLNSLS